MKGNCSSSPVLKSIRLGTNSESHKLNLESRKRRRSENFNFRSMFISPITAVDTASITPMILRRGNSWQLMLALLFLALKVTKATENSYHHAISDKIHPKHSLDQITRAIWQANDDERLSTLRKPPPSLLNKDPGEEPSSSLRNPDNRSLKANERQRERFRKDHSFDDAHFPASPEERHRLLIYCGENQSQEDCISKLLRTYDVPYGVRTNTNSGHRRRLEVIHNLKSVHALSVDVDSRTLSNLAIDQEFEFEKDFVRGPLVIDGSMAYYKAANEDRNRFLQESQEIPWGLDAIKAQEVWREYGVKGKGVKICVLDSGVMASHEDFRQSNFDGYYGNEFVSPHWYEDRKGHGTHITGTIAASDNTIGIVGIAPEAETYVVRVFDDDRTFYDFADGTAYGTDLIAASTICKKWGADIINASLGGSKYSRIEEDFFRNLYYESGILTVAASGNGGDNQNVYPASYEGVLSVGAVDESLKMAKFSTWDPTTTDVLAPGVNILSTFKDNVYATFSGTSMAAPHATGALALILSYIKETQKDTNRQEIFHALKQSTAAVDTSRVDRKEGSNDSTNASPTKGLIDVYAAIKYLENNDRDVVGRSPVVSQKETSTECESEVELNITTDSKGNEIYYRLMRLSDNEVIWMTGPNTLDNYSTYSETSCLEGPEDCYQFDVRDKGNDGISEGGGIEIIYNGHKLYKGGNFGTGGILKFGNCDN